MRSRISQPCWGNKQKTQLQYSTVVEGSSKGSSNLIMEGLIKKGLSEEETHEYGIKGQLEDMFKKNTRRVSWQRECYG